jgi:hypothetical protein
MISGIATLQPAPLAMTDNRLQTAGNHLMSIPLSAAILSSIGG